jgi:hypothetical protein
VDRAELKQFKAQIQQKVAAMWKVAEDLVATKIREQEDAFRDPDIDAYVLLCRLEFYEKLLDMRERIESFKAKDRTKARSGAKGAVVTSLNQLKCHRALDVSDDPNKNLTFLKIRVALLCKTTSTTPSTLPPSAVAEVKAILAQCKKAGIMRGLKLDQILAMAEQGSGVPFYKAHFSAAALYKNAKSTTETQRAEIEASIASPKPSLRKFEYDRLHKKILEAEASLTLQRQSRQWYGSKSVSDAAVAKYLANQNPRIAVTAKTVGNHRRPARIVSQK